MFQIPDFSFLKSDVITYGPKKILYERIILSVNMVIFNNFYYYKKRYGYFIKKKHRFFYKPRQFIDVKPFRLENRMYVRVRYNYTNNNLKLISM